jgi:hypothetical protein
VSAALRPTPEQELLLRAALGPTAAARTAFDAWRARQDVEDVEGPSYRVLGLLANRLGELGGEDLAPRLASVRRATWLRTHALLARVAPVVAALGDAGIPAMLGKGAAVLAHTGWNVADRPMDDVDVVVPLDRALEAVGVVRAHGFECALLPADPGATQIYLQTHALNFWDEAQASIDLHWHVLHGSLHASADAAFWEGARPAELNGVPCLVLSPEDTFLQVVAHGQEMTVNHPVRWAADATLLVRASGDGFDWDRVVRLARAHRLAEQIGAALESLHEVDPALVPGAPRAELGRRPRLAVRARGRGEAFWEGPLAPSRAERIAGDAREWVRRTTAPGRRPGAGQVVRGVAEALAVPPRDLARHAAWVASSRRVAALAPSDRPAPAAPPFGIPHGLGFKVDDDGTAYLRAGWWAPDDHGTWSRGREAVLAIPLATRHERPLHLRFTVVPYLAPTWPHLEVDVYEHRDRVARWGFSAVGPVEEGRDVTVPAAAQRDALVLRFVIRSPVSPQTARVDADPRPLGFAVRAVLVTETPPS